MTTTDRARPAGWNFDGMGEEFDTHVAAHLPGYADVQRLVTLFASFAVPTGGTVADLGASTGLTAALIREALPDRDLTFELYDSDVSMLSQAAKRIPESHRHLRRLPCPLEHEGADLTVAMWLLQFLSPADRVTVLKDALFSSARHGAILIASKTRHADSRWEDVAIAALDDYKTEQGVTAEERAAKTRSLRGVMHTVTGQGLLEELTEAGWHNPVILWRWHVWTVVGAFASAQH